MNSQATLKGVYESCMAHYLVTMHINSGFIRLSL